MYNCAKIDGNFLFYKFFLTTLGYGTEQFYFTVYFTDFVKALQNIPENFDEIVLIFFL